jgi:hypothetical protein
VFLELAELLSIAELALKERECSPEERLSLIEAYSKGFDSWLVAQGGEAALIKSNLPKDMLIELGQKHEAILGLAETLKSQNIADLKSLESRGRAILAYMEKVPGRASRLKETKG